MVNYLHKVVSNRLLPAPIAAGNGADPGDVDTCIVLAQLLRLPAGDDLINSMAKYHALGDDADDAMANALVTERGAAFTGVLTLSESCF